MILGVSSSSLSSLYRQQTTDYSKQLEQIASGRRFTRPSDDFAGFSKLRSAEASVAGYMRVNDELVKGKEYSAVASSTGNAAYEGLLELKQMAVDYADADGDSEREDQLKAAFTAKAKQLSDLFTNNAKVDGKAISGTKVQVNPGDDTSLLTLTLTNTATELGALDIEDDSTISDALEKVATYTAEADAFSASVDRQLTINQNIISAKENTVAAIGAIDEVSALGKATALQVRQQATIAMASQANLSQLNLARLFQ